MPTDDDIAALKADGYLGEVITDLRDRQVGPADSAAVAAHALAVLAGILSERQAVPGAPA
jgi:hypothetical protein